AQSGALSSAEWVLLTAQAVVVAALLEELFFRGVVQPYLARRSYRADLAVFLSPVVAFLHGPWPAVVFALVMIGAYAWARRYLSAEARAVFAAALLFAVIHPVWPTPVPLFLLGLALGWVAQRTRGLVAPVTLHALFNAVSTLLLLTRAV